MELPSSIVTLGLFDPMIAEPLLNKKPESLDVWACFGVNPIDMP